MKRRTLVVAGAALACASAAVGLLAGFVPPQENVLSLRRRAENLVAVAGPGDMPAPIERMGDGVRVWAVRRDAVQTVRTPGNAVSVPAGAVVSFDDRGVRLELGDASLRFAGNVANAAPLAPLVSMDGMTVPVLVAGQPVRYGEALDMRGRSLRWQGAEALLEGYALPGPRVGELDFEELMPLPLFSGGPLLAHASRFRTLVEDSARRYNLSPELGFAIIHSESTFTIGLVSPRSAMGLMQLLPTTAGDEIHRFLYGSKGEVSFEELSRPDINIRYGTTYIHILLTRYFGGVHDSHSREFCMMAAYNMGPNRLLRFFGKTPREAVDAINALSSEELYRVLTTDLPVRETRCYVAKVRHYRQAYASARQTAPGGAVSP